jgi:hypothetical protein
VADCPATDGHPNNTHDRWAIRRGPHVPKQVQQLVVAGLHGLWRVSPIYNSSAVGGQLLHAIEARVGHHDNRETAVT